MSAGHQSVVFVGRLLGDQASDPFVEMAGPAHRDGMDLVGADHRPQGTVASGDVDRAEQGMGGRPGDVRPEDVSHRLRRHPLDASDIDDQLIGSQMGPKFAEGGPGGRDGRGHHHDLGAIDQSGHVGASEFLRYVGDRVEGPHRHPDAHQEVGESPPEAAVPDDRHEGLVAREVAGS